MQEVRREVRQKSLMSARIVFNGGSSTFDCTVRDISESGMRLELSDALTLPREFDLHITRKGHIYRVAIAWRGAGMIGVKIVDANGQVSRPDLEAELAHLKRENAELRAQLKSMSVDMDLAVTGRE